jgi:ATP-binding cassette subfamily F protein 3
MDEPTTHLDLSSVDALLYALSQFDGTLVFISHDVYFIRSLANHVINVENGTLTHYPGDYQYYLDKTATRRILELRDNQSARPTEPEKNGTISLTRERREQKRIEAEQRQTRYRNRKTHEIKVHQLEKDIAEMEIRLSELTAALENPDTYQDSRRTVEINCELKDLHDRLQQATADWESAACKLAEFDNDNSDK